MHTQSLPGSHTGALLASKFEQLLKEWDIPKEKVYLLLIMLPIMMTAMLDAHLPYLGCFSHTLQLVIHDGVFSQRYVNDMVASCRRIVGHFKRSQLAPL